MPGGLCARIAISAFLLPGPSGAGADAPVRLSPGNATASASHLPCCAPDRAIDGNPQTAWNASGFPPQWIAIDAGAPKSFTRLEAVVSQDPEGVTRHDITTSLDGITYEPAGSLEGFTANGQTLSTPLYRAARYVKVESARSPSWIGWHEIRLFEQDPTRQARFVDQRVPLAMVSGQSYPVAVTMRNIGVDTWTSGGMVRLESQHPPGNATWSVTRVELPHDVAPNETVTFSFSVVAPATPGSHDFRWRMVQEAVGPFGDFSAGATVQVDPPQAAHGFADPYLVTGAVRSEFPPGYGTASNYVNLWYAGNGLPGREGCLWNAADAFDLCPGRAGTGTGPMWPSTVQAREACGGSTVRIGDSWLGCLDYRADTYFALNSPGANHWKIHANNDPGFDQCRAGPPGQSESIIDPLAMPGARGLYKIAMEPNAKGRKTLDLSVNPGEHSFYCDQARSHQYSIPFLSVGAHAQSNGGPLGIIHALGGTGSDVLHFQAQIRGYQPSACDEHLCPPLGVHAGVLLTARWGGVRRMLFLDLYQEGVLVTRAPVSARWNWPLADSMFWPGGDLAILAAGSPQLLGCGLSIPMLATGSPDGEGPQHRYAIPMSRVFGCAANVLGLFTEAMPLDASTAIEGIHWYIESSGPQGRFRLGIEDPVVRPF